MNTENGESASATNSTENQPVLTFEERNGLIFELRKERENSQTDQMDTEGDDDEFYQLSKKEIARLQTLLKEDV